MEEIHMSSLAVSVIGACLTLLFGVIAFFLSRLVRQFDRLADEVGTLNETMKRIDKDLSGDVGILKAENNEMKNRVRDFDPLWDRMRAVESDIVAIKSGGCNVCKRCA